MKALYSFLLILALTSTANADFSRELRSAQKALAAGDYGHAFTEYSRFAKEKGNPLAQFTLALFYDYGWGRAIDRAAACRWYEKAAEGTIPAAAHFLGQCLIEGVHRPANPKQAAHWFQEAADLGHYYSLCSLAELYVEGKGVKRDPAKGLTLCQQAAERGVVKAMERMGQFYLEGDEQIHDPTVALQWFGAAAERNSVQSQYQVGIMLRDGLGQLANPLSARYWLERAASQGYIKAYYPVAKLYFNAPPNPETGMWSEHDLAKAYMWLSTALQRSKALKEQEEAEKMMTRVQEVMPKTWAQDLDAKVAEHFAAQTKPTKP